MVTLEVDVMIIFCVTSDDKVGAMMTLIIENRVVMMPILSLMALEVLGFDAAKFFYLPNLLDLTFFKTGDMEIRRKFG